MNSKIVLTALTLVLLGCGVDESTMSEATTAKEGAHAEDNGDHEDSHAGEEHAEDHDENDAGHAEGEHQGEGRDGEGGHVELTDEQASAAGLELADVGPAKIYDSLPLYGTIVPNAERTRDVSARFPGVVRSVTKRVGDPVRKGETLASVEANESLQTYSVAAPLNGVITARNTNPGEQTGDKSLFTVADLSTVWVELALFPRDAGKVRVGQRVRLTNTGPDQPEGEVIYIVPFGRAESQTLTARVLFKNPERRLAPGLYVTAAVLQDESEVPMAVLSSALQTLEGRNVVFVQTGDGFEAKTVEVGRSDGRHTEIHLGLKAGARYVAKNSFILKAELGKGEAEHSH